MLSENTFRIYLLSRGASCYRAVRSSAVRLFPNQFTVYKKLRYREEHSASVVLKVGVPYDISREKIC